LELTAEEEKALGWLAAAEGVSVEEVARRAISEYLADWEGAREAYLSGFVARYANLLKRLAE
jgi:hypothetical protein